jgi:hypothetical protein
MEDLNRVQKGWNLSVSPMHPIVIPSRYLEVSGGMKFLGKLNQ